MGQTRRGKKGERQTELENAEYLGETGEEEVGRAGGNLQRDIGTEDTKERAFERPAGITRVEKSDEQEKGSPREGERKRRKKE